MYALLFCRILLATIFTASLVGKFADFESFVAAVGDLLPSQSSLSDGLAMLVLAGEATVIVCMLAPQPLARAGFLLAALLLIVFTIAIGSALYQKKSFVCNCFGKSAEDVSVFTLLRNGLLLLVAASGIWLASSDLLPTMTDQYSLQLLLIALPAICIGLVIAQIDTLVGALNDLRA